MTSPKYQEIEIRNDIFANLQQIVTHSLRFGSVDEYVSFVLQNLVDYSSNPDGELNKSMTERL